MSDPSSPLSKLLSCGQSYWLDNLTRDMLENGELKRRVAEESLRGMTSNPATFQKAIAGSSLYDKDLRGLASAGLTAEQIYERLAVADVQAACDVLRPVHETSRGLDGYVSLEVSPHLAHDARGTLEQARRLHAAVGRPNVLIKIPGTRVGLQAIEDSLYEGISVNVTLLFSVQRYEEVAEAYIRALERRLGSGAGLQGITSVASFFLSRIDVLVDQLLAHRPEDQRRLADGSELEGRAAVASAVLAYQSFLRLFGSERWRKLAKAGARVQRPLWASTSTKNPRYRDVKYVEPLVGRDTVNTMPEVTIAAFKDHGVAAEDAVLKGVDGARQLLARLEAIGIHNAGLAWQLENEGVQKFIEPFDALLQLIEKKRASFVAAK